MIGRDPMLVEYAQQEPILTDAERDRILARAASDPEGLLAESRHFWRTVNGTASLRWAA